MKFCNNCGSKPQDNVRICTECGAQVGTVIENNKEKEELHGNIHNNMFSYNGINVDLNDIKIRHGINKINAIKELRDKTGMGIKESKEVIDIFTFGEKAEVKTINTGTNNKIYFPNIVLSIMHLFIWIFYLPVMLIKKILKTEKYSRSKKALLIIGSLIISLPHIVIYIASFIIVPKLFLIVAGYFLIYTFMRKRETKNLEVKLMKEEAEQLELEKKNKIVNKTLDIIFNNKEMNTRLKEFVLKHTKRYDNEQIDCNDYLEKVDLFLVYINRMIDSQIEIRKEDCPKDVIDYWDEENIIIERRAIEEFIETKKMKIYSDDVKKLIDVEKYEKLDDVIHEYIDIFGENSLKELNLKILSDSLNETYGDISNIVNTEFSKIKKEYEMRKLQEELFNSDISLKDIEYIDTLSGFEFEDYLEELFISFGYSAKELPYSNDYGADLIISKGFNEIVIQAKNYTGNVGNKAVQEVIAANSYYKCDIGMVITNAYYTQNAIKTAEASEIILVE